jgi:Anti-sigma-K factor rskA, C-terminal
MEARTPEPFGQQPPAASADPALARASVPPWYRRVAFWRAVAGMALAVAIACAAVTAEYSSTLFARTHYYRTRLHRLSSSITKMRGKITIADRELARMRNAAEVNDGWRRIIAESDYRLIRLAGRRPANAPAGLIALSPGLRRAAIEIHGLPVLPRGNAYVLWWTRGKQAPLKAARLKLGDADKGALVIALPAHVEKIEGAILTVDSAASTAKPAGVPVLKGTIEPTPAPDRHSIHKSG